MVKLPFMPLSPRLTENLSNRFLFLADPISKMFPLLKTKLLQADFDISPREYTAIAVMTGLFYYFLVLFLFTFLTLVSKQDFIVLGFIVAFIVFAFMFLSVVFYPNIVGSRRTRALDANLVPALRHLLIEIKSGVPLFNAMVGVSKDYKEVSVEFRKIVKDISTGMKESDVLDLAAHRNPSFQFRRAIWQINNAVRSGSDLGIALAAIIEDLSKEQIIAIRKYGQELNPWTMIYMMAAVIIPSLGLTFLVVISAFSSTVIPKIIYPMLIAGLVGFQLFFMNFVKSKRPPV